MSYELLEELQGYLPSSNLLFHFTRWRTGIENILVERTLKLGCITDTNDPWEFQPLQTIATGSGRDADLSAQLRLGDQVALLRRNVLLACFCKDYLDEPNQRLKKAWMRARMWAQYAENHSGICLIFKQDRLEKVVKDQFENSWSILSKDVTYLGDGDVIRRAMDVTEIRGGDPIVSPHDRLLNSADTLLFSKLDDFCDEREWRLALVTRQNLERHDSVAPVYASYGESLVGLIIGPRFPDVYLPALEACSRVPIFRADWFNGEAVLDEANRM